MRAVCHVDEEVTAALGVSLNAILDAIQELEQDPSLRGVAQDQFSLWQRSPDGLITRERLALLGREVGQAFVGELQRVGTSYLLNDVDVNEYLKENVDASAHVEADWVARLPGGQGPEYIEDKIRAHFLTDYEFSERLLHLFLLSDSTSLKDLVDSALEKRSVFVEGEQLLKSDASDPLALQAVKFVAYQLGDTDLEFDKASLRWKNTATGQLSKDPMKLVEDWGVPSEEISPRALQLLAKSASGLSDELLNTVLKAVRDHVFSEEVERKLQHDLLERRGALHDSSLRDLLELRKRDMLDLKLIEGRGRVAYGEDWKAITAEFKSLVGAAERERDSAVAHWSQSVSDKQRERLVGVLRAAKTSAFYSSVHTSTRRLLKNSIQIQTPRVRSKSVSKHKESSVLWDPTVNRWRDVTTGRFSVV
jgi:hypothetical protein